MTFTKLIFLTTASVLAIHGSALAQHRIGVVNPQTVLNALPERDAVERRLTDYQTELQTELQRRYQAFQQASNQYQARKSTLSPTAQREEESRLGRTAIELQQFERGFAQLLQTRQSELMRPILEEMNLQIEAIATELKLDYILNQKLAENQFPMIFLVNRTQTPFDITQRLIDQLKK
jgi:outer membrane protein